MSGHDRTFASAPYSGGSIPSMINHRNRRTRIKTEWNGWLGAIRQGIALSAILEESIRFRHTLLLLLPGSIPSQKKWQYCTGPKFRKRLR